MVARAHATRSSNGTGRGVAAGGLKGSLAVQKGVGAGREPAVDALKSRFQTAGPQRVDADAGLVRPAAELVEDDTADGRPARDPGDDRDALGPPVRSPFATQPRATSTPS